MSLVVVDCHMVGQAAAGDAGNGRYAATLLAAMAATAPEGDRVASLVATPGGGPGPGAVRGHARRAPGRRAAPGARRPAGAGRCSGRRGRVHLRLARVDPCPTMLAVHDATFMTNPEWLGGRARMVLRGLVPRSARRAAVVLALSETAAADVADGPAARSRQDPRGEPPSGPGVRARARCGRAGGAALRSEPLLPGGRRPGTAEEPGALGAAVRLLRAQGTDLALALVGKPGPGGARIAADAGGLWLGPVDDPTLADLYRAAAVTAYPSLYEGFGLPVVEAMACASPVVASDRGAIPEVAGDAAILVEPSPRAIAEGIRRALDPDEAARLRAAGPGGPPLHPRRRWDGPRGRRRRSGGPREDRDGRHARHPRPLQRLRDGR